MEAAENKKLVREAFDAMMAGDVSPFFDLLSDDLHWTVIGSCPISCTYTNKQDFLKGATGPVFDKLASPIRPTLRQILADEDQVVLQWDGEALTKTGVLYFNTFCWVMRLESGKVKNATAYIDTEAATKLLAS